MATPTEINLHRKSKVLEVTFDDGEHYSLPAEYLRVFAPSADVKVNKEAGKLVMGKQDVNISQLTPVGNYAIQIHFDDGHDAGVFSWKTLHDLGRKQEKNWAEYQNQIKRNQRAEKKPKKGVNITILYFIDLVKKFGKQEENVDLPYYIITVEDLLRWLRRRGDNYESALADDAVTVTVNKQFVPQDWTLLDNDEVAIVPKAKL